MASAHVDRRGRILIASIAAAGALAVLLYVAPAFAAEPTPDPPPTGTTHTPDPPPAPPEPQPSPPEPVPAPSPSLPASSSSSSSSTQASGSDASSTAKPDGRPAKRKHRKVTHRHRELQGRSEALQAGTWQRARNEALAAALTLPAGASEAVVVRAMLSPSPASAPFLPAALAAALATLLLAATPSFALNASRVLRPVEERRFELATIGLCILVGIAVAKGLPA